MTKHYCDICGKEMQNCIVTSYNDPLDYKYGECQIEFAIPLSGEYIVGFDEICNECAQIIKGIKADDFREFFIKHLMKIKTK